MAGKKEKGKGKGKAKKKSADDGPSINETLLRKTLKLYDMYSSESNVKCCPDVVKAINQCLEDNVELKKILVRPIEKDLKLEERFKKALAMAIENEDVNTIKELKANYVNNVPPISVEALMKALNQVQITTCKELFIVDLPLSYMDLVQITHFIRLSPMKKLEIVDCLLQPESVSRFAPVINSKRMLTNINLDYNEFGDKGCLELCRGLVNNVSLLSLSLSYCNLTSKSGQVLGDILSTTAIKDLYLNGNELRCQGVIDLLKTISEECENEILKQESQEREKLEEELRRLSEDESKPSWEKQQGAIDVESGGDVSGKEDKDKESGKKKKKKKKKKGKKSDEPPKVGPFACKLHLADNAIDLYEDGSDQLKSLKILHETMDIFVRIIKYSPDIEEIDLWNNSIGNMSVKMLLNALEYRKLKKVGPLGLSVTEKIEKELFDAILKSGKKVKKKKKKK